MSLSEKIYSEAVGSKLDYSVDWSSWLETDEVISSSTWSVDSTVTLSLEAINGGVTSVFVEDIGLSRYRKVKVFNTIETDQGRVDTRYFVIYFVFVSST